MLSNVLLCYLHIQLEGGHDRFYSALHIPSPTPASGHCINATAGVFSVEVVPLPPQVLPLCLVYLLSTEG